MQYYINNKNIFYEIMSKSDHEKNVNSFYNFLNDYVVDLPIINETDIISEKKYTFT